MLIRSISSGHDQPMPQATAAARICGSSCALRRALSDLESAGVHPIPRAPKTTAAAVTGPASGPRPASSMPQIRFTMPHYRVAAGRRKGSCDKETR